MAGACVRSRPGRKECEKRHSRPKSRQMRVRDARARFFSFLFLGFLLFPPYECGTPSSFLLFRGSRVGVAEGDVSAARVRNGVSGERVSAVDAVYMRSLTMVCSLLSGATVCLSVSLSLSQPRSLGVSKNHDCQRAVCPTSSPVLRLSEDWARVSRGRAGGRWTRMVCARADGCKARVCEGRGVQGQRWAGRSSGARRRCRCRVRVRGGCSVRSAGG